MLIWLNFIIYCIYIDCKKEKAGDTGRMLGFGFCLKQYWKPSAATKHYLSLLHLLMNALTEQNSLVVLDGFDPCFHPENQTFVLPSTLSPLLPFFFCPFSLLKDEIPVSSELPCSSHWQGYLFPASHQHTQSQLSCTANLLCCANTRYCQGDAFLAETV